MINGLKVMGLETFEQVLSRIIICSHSVIVAGHSRPPSSFSKGEGNEKEISKIKKSLLLPSLLLLAWSSFLMVRQQATIINPIFCHFVFKALDGLLRLRTNSDSVCRVGKEVKRKLVTLLLSQKGRKKL
jgi:hypothetical protein